MMPKQKSMSKRTAIRQAIRMFLVGEGGIAGAALVEFTLIAPLLVIATVYTMDFGFLFYNKMEVQNAGQAGAQWAIANRVYNQSAIKAAAQNAAYISGSGVTVNSTQFCGCSVDSSGSNAVVTPVGSSATCTLPTCTSSASGTCTACTSKPNTTCNTNGVEGNYVTVVATPPATVYQSRVAYQLVPSTYSANLICGSSTARIQ
jgi:Flp pilus assembly protein TadG